MNDRRLKIAMLAAFALIGARLWCGPALAQEDPQPPRPEAEPGQIIHVGDRLNISVAGAPELSGDFIIGPDGKLYLPLLRNIELPPIQAANRSTDSVTGALEAVLSKYFVEPRVRVILSAVGDDQAAVPIENRVSLLSPSRGTVFRWANGMRVMDLLVMSGNMPSRESINPREVTLIRDDGREILQLDITGLLAGQVTSPAELDAVNPRLMPGDYVIVPFRDAPFDVEVIVFGMVRRPATYKLPLGRKVMDAVSAAGGTVGRAAVGNTFVLRNINGRNMVIGANLKRLTDHGDLSQNIPLMDGDIIYVPETGRIDIKGLLDDLADIIELRRRFVDVADDIKDTYTDIQDILGAGD